MFTQKFIKIFHSVQEIELFSFFQNLALGKTSTNDKCHFAISWTRCRQYQCVCKLLSKSSKRFRVIDIFHVQVGGHSMKVNLEFQLTFLGSCNSSFWQYVPTLCKNPFSLKVERWVEWGSFHNFTLKYHIHNSRALCFDMQPYWKLHQLIFEGKNGLKVKFWIKAT